QCQQIGCRAQLADHGRGSWKNLWTSTPVWARKCSDREGSSWLCRSSSIFCTRCMGKNTTLALAASPDFTSWVKSSSDCKSTPRTFTPAGSRDISTPQNFSRGLYKVTRTSCPETMFGRAPTAAAQLIFQGEAGNCKTVVGHFLTHYRVSASSDSLAPPRRAGPNPGLAQAFRPGWVSAAQRISRRSSRQR